MTAGIYLRVSTRDRQDINTQRLALQEYCEKEKLNDVKWYEDVGESGAKDSRPAFNNLLEDMRNKNVDLIITYKLDRIGRSLQHLLQLFQEFKNRNIKFISITQTFLNTDTAEGKLILHILMTLAEFERELNIDRIRSGIKRAKKEGKSCGRPKGKKDGKPRRKSGYWLRWSKEKKN
jgi:DNA invertase Pin-like site-specific DNA recombinase